ncbi:MAG TPA: SpoIID/LytB domain-containing protein [Marmoricola sp.]|jgi:SpoIID/LytB domain protein|nr:SpoIID/LytB domain-containing protein [Marmoricola sp.]
MRLRLLSAFGLLLIASLLCSAGPVQAHGVDEPVLPVGPTTPVTITGDGFGHGIGMSQYGAQARATAGQSAETILSFYYPQTARGTLNPMVRVLITEDDHITMVRPAKGLKVTDVGTGKTYLLPTSNKATAWRLRIVSGKTRLAWLRGKAWHQYLPKGRLLAGPAEFRAASNLVTLVYGGANHVYRGAMRQVAGRTVNVLNLDNYVRGVVPAEMPALWKPAALQAQAVAARTYAAFERAENLHDGYQICDTSACQVYRGYGAEQPTSNAAVKATAGRIVTSGGAPAFTQFSASNGGWTVAGSRSYLIAQQDTFDTTAYHHWTATIGPISTKELQAANPRLGALKSIQVTAREGHGEWGGRVTSLQLTYAGGTATMSGTTFRSTLGIRSDFFTLS